MSSITGLRALEILDSRGRPTVRATCTLASGAQASASVPSGASTGRAEAHELRDGDPRRYGGLGCRAAVANIDGPIQDALRRRAWASQAELDQALVELDGTPDKSRLGSNALLATSLSFVRAVAQERGQPLFRAFAALLGETAPRLPRPTINLFSGGEHAGRQVSIQDVLLVPVSANTMDEALAMTHAVYRAAAALVFERYGQRELTADEGGLAPPAPNDQALLEHALDAIRAAGFEPGTDVALAVDVAASHFYRRQPQAAGAGTQSTQGPESAVQRRSGSHGDEHHVTGDTASRRSGKRRSSPSAKAGTYELGDERLSAEEMIARLGAWAERYPLVSIEDGLAEDDWEHWPALRRRLPGAVLTLGDDLLCTNVERIQRAVGIGAANALLLKVNQVGTVSEALDALRVARTAGWTVVASARSGETEDDWLADLAVGWRAEFIKVGSITQSERLAKYNRLVEIEGAEGLPLAPAPGRR